MSPLVSRSGFIFFQGGGREGTTVLRPRSLVQGLFFISFPIFCFELSNSFLNWQIAARSAEYLKKILQNKKLKEERQSQAKEIFRRLIDPAIAESDVPMLLRQLEECLL